MVSREITGVIVSSDDRDIIWMEIGLLESVRDAGVLRQ